MKKVSILGATGSIGLQTLQVIKQNISEYEVVAVSAHKNIKQLLQICQQFSPKYAVVTDKKSYKEFKSQIEQTNLKTSVFGSTDDLRRIACLDEVDQVVAAIVGGAGLHSIHAAVEAGKTILLANKESLVMTGDILLDAAKKYNSTIIPLDSEHNALFQCMPSPQGFRKKSLDEAGIDKLILTASGGPFLNTPIKDLINKTPKEACLHPNWSMGEKVSIDSATMMNKGLEYIEASLLFNASPNQLDIVIHPQSIVHSLVKYKDGSHIAQLGVSSMQIPIAHALAYPNRINSSTKSFDITQKSLDFYPVDYDRYPCLKLAIQVCSDPAMRIALNAANEIAVDAYLTNQINFIQISQIVSSMLDQSDRMRIESIDDVFDLDQICRKKTKSLIKKI